MNDGTLISARKFTLSRDLAILELRHPVPHYHGVACSLDELQLGQEVDIYSFPKEGVNPFRSLLQCHGSFKGQTTNGLLAFGYSLSDGRAIHPGASGGIVVDSKTKQIVSILNEIERSGKPIALAVPAQSLADFVGTVQPFLARSLFPSEKAISPDSTDFYPKFVPPPPTGLVAHRPEETAEVMVLRGKAQALADSIRNFIAVQTFAWGSGDKVPVAESAYEVRVLEGYQRFREFPDGRKELKDVPLPPLNNVLALEGECSELPKMVGTELRLKIHQADDVVVNDLRIKVFQYRADSEDGVCRFNTIKDFIFSELAKLPIILVTAKFGTTRRAIFSACQSTSSNWARGKISRQC